jgi:NAD(P)-dependent dehydrogenase (short-subunit alcohol dehydrogenase family)
MGWRVFATCRQQADVERLERQGLTSHRLDYADEASIAAALNAVLTATGGRLDALFNNGAYAHPSAIEDLATDDLRALFEANFIGWHDLTRRVIPVMRAQKQGRIVNCSSVVGYIAGRFTAAYAASKFAVEGWSDSLRLELAGSGIHVSLIEPGPITTDFLKNARAHLAATADPSHSRFGDQYRASLAKVGRPDFFSALLERPPSAVTRALVRALDSARPRARYRVTLPAHAGAWAKRLLPTRLLDWFVRTQT